MSEQMQGKEPAKDALIGELLGLLHQTSEGMTRMAQHMAAAGRSHPTDMTAISLLARRPGQLTVGELGAELGLSKAATTSLVDRLEQPGHVLRARDPQDRRRWHLLVTNEARQMAATILSDFLDRTRTALDGYTVDELAVARRFLVDIEHAVSHRPDA